MVRLIQRDRSAAAELGSRYAPRIFALGYRLTGSRDRAVTFTADAFVRAFAGLEEIQREGLALSTYLVVSAKNVFLESVESPGGPGRRRQGTGGDTGWAWDDSERNAITRRQHEDMRLAAVSLPPTQRLALALRDVEQLSYAEIASLIGLSEAEVAHSIASARDRLRVQLGLTEPNPPTLPSGCTLMLPLLSGYVDGELTGAKLEETKEHLESCEPCQAEHDDLEEVQRRYREFIPAAPVAELNERIGLALAAIGFWEAPAEPSPASRRRLAAVLAAAVALALAGIGTAALVGGGDSARRVVEPAVGPSPFLVAPPARTQHRARGPATPSRTPATGNPHASRAGVPTATPSTTGGPPVGTAVVVTLPGSTPSHTDAPPSPPATTSHTQKPGTSRGHTGSPPPPPSRSHTPRPSPPPAPPPKTPPPSTPPGRAADSSATSVSALSATSASAPASHEASASAAAAPTTTATSAPSAATTAATAATSAAEEAVDPVALVLAHRVGHLGDAERRRHPFARNLGHVDLDRLHAALGVGGDAHGVDRRVGRLLGQPRHEAPGRVARPGALGRRRHASGVRLARLHVDRRPRLAGAP